MAYCTVAELRAEGVSVGSDERLEELIQEATADIDRLTGWFFEPRLKVYDLDGRGTASLELPAPVIRLDRVLDGGLDIQPSWLTVVGAPVEPGFDAPRITKHYGTFRKGRGNIMVGGLFGYTELDESDAYGREYGRTPRAIRRACILLVLRNMNPIADDAAFDVRNRWRILEERTRDQSYKLDRLRASGATLTGDPEIDALLSRYVRPRPMGAV